MNDECFELSQPVGACQFLGESNLASQFYVFFLPLSLSLSLALSRSLSLSHTPAHTEMHTQTHRHTHTRTERLFSSYTLGHHTSNSCLALKLCLHHGLL